MARHRFAPHENRDTDETRAARGVLPPRKPRHFVFGDCVALARSTVTGQDAGARGVVLDLAPVPMRPGHWVTVCWLAGGPGRVRAERLVRARVCSLDRVAVGIAEELQKVRLQRAQFEHPGQVNYINWLCAAQVRLDELIDQSGR